jgi:hypothetical protein
MNVQHLHTPSTPSTREGLIAGVLGAAVVALYYLGVDLTRGLALQTPSVLGEVLVMRRPDPTMDAVNTSAVMVYSGVHLLAFVAFGLLLTALVTRAETSSVARYAVLQLFIVFELFFFGLLAIVSETTRGLFPLGSVLAANTLAALVMGAWIWRNHPRLQRAFGRTPLGAPELGER